MNGPRLVKVGLLTAVLGLATTGCQPEPQGPPAAELGPPAAEQPSPQPVQQPLPPSEPGEPPVPTSGQAQLGVGNIYPHQGRPIPYSVGEDGEYIQVIKANIREAAASGQPLSRMSHKMDRVMAVVDPQPGEVIADIGSGTGFLPLWLLEHGVAVERVYAVDHNALALEVMAYMLDQAGFPDDPRVIPVHTAPKRIDLPPGVVDKVVILDLFFVLQHDFSGAQPPAGYVGPSHGDRPAMGDSFDKAAWLQGVAACMTPGGRLYVIETASQTLDREDQLPGFRRIDLRVDTKDGVYLRALTFEKEP
jgi:predicted RNA methylase